MTKEQFTTTYHPLAKKAGNRFGMNPEIILAQAALESGWGASYGARVRKNFFGITAAGSPNEFWDGSFSVGQNQYALKFRLKIFLLCQTCLVAAIQRNAFHAYSFHR